MYKTMMTLSSVVLLAFLVVGGMWELARRLKRRRRVLTESKYNRKHANACQGGNEVCFFFADPIFVRKFLILGPKSVTHFRL